MVESIERETYYAWFLNVLYISDKAMIRIVDIPKDRW
jgi:hypothetical protein